MTTGYCITGDLALANDDGVVAKAIRNVKGPAASVLSGTLVCIVAVVDS